MAQTFTSFTPVEEAGVTPPANFTSFTPLEEAAPAPVPVSPRMTPQQMERFVKPAAPVQPSAPPQALAAAPDKSFSPLEEISKGAVGAVKVGIPSSVEQIKIAGGADALQGTIQQMQLLDKIDKGEVKSPNELPRDPRVRMYFASNPEVRGRLRQSINDDLTKNQAFVDTSLNLLSQYQREGQKYAGRQEKVLDSEGMADFGNWLTRNIGAGAVYAIPSIIAAVTLKQPGLLATGVGMGYSEAVSSRLEAMGKELKALPPEQRAARVAQRLQETDDVNLAVAIASGALDTVLGPAAKIAKEGIRGSIKAMGRTGAAKEAVKELPKQAGQEFVAGSLQAGAQAAGKVQTGEREKFATMETAKEMFESGASEGAGSLGPTVGMGAVRVAATPGAPKAATEETPRIEPTLEPEQEQPAPPVDKRQALKDAITKRAKPAAVEPVATVVPPEVQSAPPATPEQIKEAAAQLERRGVDPADAIRIATIRLGGTTEVQPDAQTAVDQEGTENVAEPISEPSGGSVAVPAQPTVDISATAGAEQAERDGVVSAEPDAGKLADGKGIEPFAVTPAERTNFFDGMSDKVLDDLTKSTQIGAPLRNAAVEETQRRSGAKDAERIKAEDEQNAAYEAKKAKAESIAKSNASTAFDQVGDYASVDEAIDSYRTNMADTLAEEGLRKGPDSDSLLAAAERAFEAEVTQRKGTTTDGTTTTETVQAKEEEQKAPAAGAVKKKNVGRPPAALTEEERAEKEKNSKKSKAEYMRGERSLPKLQAKLDEAAAPVDETNIADDEGLVAAQNEKRVLKRDTINAMLDLEAKHRGSPLGKRVKAALADRSKISQKDYDDVVAGRKYKEQERVNKSTASNEEVEGADEGFNKATTASQALGQVIKTGTGFQKFLAKRLRNLVRNVKFVVVEETDPLPEQLSRHQDAWGSDNARARGVYFENTATGEKIIFVRGASAGGFQGINNTTVLHEALHAATQQKLELALIAVKRGFSTDAKLTRAYNDLIAVMNNAKDEYNRLSNLGQLPTDIYYLKTVSGVFSNPHEFVSYGMTDPYFQKFLMGAYGFKEETSFFTRFVDAVREMFGMGLDTVNALSDLIAVTDEILSAKLTPTMQMLAKADKANAKREARVSKVYAQTPKMPEETPAVIQETQADIEARVQYHLEQIQKSENAEEIAKQASMLNALRDPKKILPALNRLWKYMSYKQKQLVLIPLHIDAAASWGSSYVPELANTNVLMQKMAGMTEVLLEAAADVSTDAMRVFAKNPEEQIKIQKVALAATLARIDPADKTATKRSATLDKMYNGLTAAGQRVYNGMRDHLNDMTDYYMFLLEESINAENIPADGKALIMARIKQIYEASKKITPYFALTREGPYWLSIGKGDTREFYMRPSMTERDALAEELAAERGVPVSDFVTGNNIEEMRKDTYLKSDLLKDVFAAIDATKDTDPNAKENLKNSVYELYLRTMPEASFRGQFAERKNITGFSTDVLRGFNETSVKMALQLSKLKYSPQLRTSISAARDSAKGRPDVEPFVDDMERRVLSTLSPRERGFLDSAATLLNRMSAITYLSGPSTALIQPISILQTGYVILGARHGYGKAAAELGKMSKFWDEYAVTKKRLDGTTAWVMPTIENSKVINLNEEEKWAVKQMRLRAVTSSTYASELFEFDSKSTEEVMSKTEKAKVAAQAMTFGLLHSADRITREVVWIASYRLNRRNGKTPEQAVNQAVIDTNESQGNFADYAKSSLMKGPGGRLALQFTTYALNVTTLLLRNFYRMIAGLNGEGRLEAFKIFFGTLSSTALIAGITGLPTYSVVMALLSWAWEEKERPQELKDLSRTTWFTEVYLPEKLGSITLGGYKLNDLNDMVATGVLNKFTGLDFASRTGLNDMFFREGKETKTAREAFVAAAIDQAGPAASMILNWTDAYEAFSQGDSQKGLEKITPAIARNLLIANKYATEGAKDNKGNVIAKPEAFSKWDLFGQAIGLRSAPLANVQAVNFKITAMEKRIDNERTDLLNNLDRAYRKKDLKEYAKISNDINKRFNVMYPYAAIDEIEKSLETRAEARGKSWRGVDVDEKNSGYAYEAGKKSREAIKKKEEAK